MKKIILLFALFVSFIAGAQNFPGEGVEFLKDRTLKVLPTEESLQKYGYRDFFTDANLKKVYEKAGTSTAYMALAGKEFKVISFEPYKNVANQSKYKLLIENGEIGKLYYDYDPKSAKTFPFEVIGGLEMPEGYYCNTITSEKTDEGEVFYKTKASDGVIFKKCFGADGIYYVLRINTPSYLDENKGLSVQLSNNAKIERQNAKLLPIDNGIGGKAYFSLMILKSEEVTLLKNNEIVKTVIGGAESNVKNGAMLKSYFNCLVDKEPDFTIPSKTSTADCSQITVNKDTKTGKTYYNTPAIDGIILRKVKAGAFEAVYMGSITIPSQEKLEGKGVMLLFDKGDLINYPDAEVLEKPLPNGTYEYISIFLIENQHLSFFGASGIKSVKVIKPVKLISKGAEIQKLANCLIKK